MLQGNKALTILCLLILVACSTTAPEGKIVLQSSAATPVVITATETQFTFAYLQQQCLAGVPITRDERFVVGREQVCSATEKLTVGVVVDAIVKVLLALIASK